MKFLIVADSPDDLKRIAQGLQKEFPCFESVEVFRKEDFVKAVAWGDFDVAITEDGLSWADGLWALGMIRGQSPDVPVIMVTSAGREEVAVAGMKAGLSDYVLKEALRRLPVAVRESLEKVELRQRESALQRTHDELELRVQERTFELLNAIELLKREIAERKRIEEALRQKQEQVQSFSRRLMEAQEAERLRIARELHDEVGQVLTGLKLTLERGAGDGKGRALVGELIARVHRMSLDLRPSMLDDLGLLPALLWHFERYTAQTGVRVAFRHTGLKGRRFAPEVEIGAYRIVQEALTNVARHARVSEAAVRLWADEETLGIQVEDRGAGFDPEAALAVRDSIGLSGLRERAALLGGRLAVESAPGAGACLRAELPLKREA